jgi:hypothetical protein
MMSFSVAKRKPGHAWINTVYHWSQPASITFVVVKQSHVWLVADMYCTGKPKTTIYNSPVALCIATASAGGEGAWMPAVCGFPPLVQHPAGFQLSCDGNVVVFGTHWQRWGAPTATGTGTIDLVFSCTPTCVSAPRHQYPVKVIVTHIVLCGHRRTYSDVTAIAQGSETPQEFRVHDETLVRVSCGATPTAVPTPKPTATPVPTATPPVPTAPAPTSNQAMRQKLSNWYSSWSSDFSTFARDQVSATQDCAASAVSKDGGISCAADYQNLAGDAQTVLTDLTLQPPPAFLQTVSAYLTRSMQKFHQGGNLADNGITAGNAAEVNQGAQEIHSAEQLLQDASATLKPIARRLGPDTCGGGHWQDFFGQKVCVTP